MRKLFYGFIIISQVLILIFVFAIRGQQTREFMADQFNRDNMALCLNDKIRDIEFAIAQNGDLSHIGQSYHDCMYPKNKRIFEYMQSGKLNFE